VVEKCMLWLLVWIVMVVFSLEIADSTFE